VSQNQTAQPAAAQHTAAEQEAYDLTFVAALFFHFVFLALITFTPLAEQMSQGQTAQPATAQPAATEQHSQNLPVFAFDLGIVQSRFSFHCFAPYRLTGLLLIEQFINGLLPLPGFAKPAAEHAAQQKSMQNAPADRARYEEVADEKSPDLLLFIILVLSIYLILPADDTENSGLKSFVESGLNLLHFVLSDQPPTLLLGKFFVLSSSIDLLYLDDPAHRWIDRHDQLLHFLFRSRFES
jgi:hypothetical protein